jgi:hypothetical protein
MRGYTVAELALRWRCSPDRIRSFIKRGELAALNTAVRRCGRPRYVVTPEALAEFESGRFAATTDPPKPKRQKKPKDFIDYYPD